ncbi:MAG: AAA family ATPase [Flavobacteriales bacterium]|nr:AAA family ATPase [Flavobacteriales bacterium]
MEILIAILIGGGFVYWLGQRSGAKLHGGNHSSAQKPTAKEASSADHTRFQKQPVAPPQKATPPPRPAPPPPPKRIRVVPPPENIELTPEFKAALELLENTATNLFITGKAGTGKSTLLRHFMSTTEKRCVVLAPTGLAAVQISGATIHSFFRFAPRLLEPAAIQPDGRYRALYENVDVIIIDEVSMVRADMMQAMDIHLRRARRRDEPFGGVQMVFFGDLFQLPPVVTSDVAQYFYDRFGGPFCFQTPAWQDARVKRIQLTKIFRQSDTAFIEVLNAVRVGEVEDHHWKKLNTRVDYFFQVENQQDEYITLAPTNRRVDETNATRLATLREQTFTFRGQISGDFKQSNCPAPEVLELKKGAQVMMVKNHGEKMWVNGSIGKVHSVSNDLIEVDIEDRIYPVQQEAWETVEYEYDREKRKMQQVVVGTFRQYPMKLAWAITIHKSQGLTFDRVHIDMGNGAFAHGQTYVALSRCRTLEGIVLRQPVGQGDLKVDPLVVAYFNTEN